MPQASELFKSLCSNKSVFKFSVKLFGSEWYLRNPADSGNVSKIFVYFSVDVCEFTVVENSQLPEMW